MDGNNILQIESSGGVCSVALARDEKITSIRENNDGRSHAVMLAVFVEEVLKEASVLPQGLNAIAVSKGPGSYTGLRIGVSLAKGMAYALNIPLLGINTLESMVQGLLTRYPEYSTDNYFLCPMIDARRLEVYTCVFSFSGKPVSDIRAEIINKMSFSREMKNRKMIFFGSGAEKCKEIILNENAVFIDDFQQSASFMTGLASLAYHSGKFEDTAYFEPFYLKDFVAGPPAKKLI